MTKHKTKVKKLTLNKETLRDLMAHDAGEVKGGAKSKNCGPPTGHKVTACGVTCPTNGVCTGYTCFTCGYCSYGVC